MPRFTGLTGDMSFLESNNVSAQSFLNGSRHRSVRNNTSDAAQVKKTGNQRTGSPRRPASRPLSGRPELTVAEDESARRLRIRMNSEATERSVLRSAAVDLDLVNAIRDGGRSYRGPR